MAEGPHGTEDRSAGADIISVEDGASKLMDLVDDNAEPGDDPSITTDDGGQDEEEGTEQDDGGDDGEGRDDEGSDGEGDEHDDDDDDDEDDEETFSVKVNGEDTNVTEAELKAGYSRQADYTRKTQELADERRQFVTEQEATRGTRDEYLGQLKKLNKALEVPEPDWDHIKRQTPDTYAQQYADWQVAEGKRKVLRDEEVRVEKEATDSNAVLTREFVTSQHELLRKAIPDFADAEKGKALRTKLVDYARNTYGVTEQEVDGLVNHVQLVLLHKAMQFDVLTSKARNAKGKRKKAGPVSRPGGDPAKGRRKGRGDSKGASKARDRLASSGTIADATASLLDMEDFGGE